MDPIILYNYKKPKVWHFGAPGTSPDRRLIECPSCGMQTTLYQTQHQLDSNPFFLPQLAGL